jgi:putative phosphoesterase
MTGKLKEDILPKHAGQVQMLIHLGDYVKDMRPFQRSYPDLPMHFVGGSFESGEEQEKIIDLGPAGANKRIMAMHGHTKDVKEGLQRLFYHAESQGVDACFFGHTHEVFQETQNGVFFMNPGSITFPRNSPGMKGSFGIVTVSPAGEFSGEVLYV